MMILFSKGFLFYNIKIVLEFNLTVRLGFLTCLKHF